MPRLDHRVVTHHRWTPGEQALVLLLRDLINEVRTQGALAPLTEAEIQQRLAQLVRHTARKERP